MRDRATLVQIVVMPLIQLLILSNVATFAIKQSPVYVVDFDRSSTSRGLVSRLARRGCSTSSDSRAPATADDAMLRGARDARPHDPPRLRGDRCARKGTAPLHLDVNAEKGSAAGIVQSYVAQILSLILDASCRRRSIRTSRVLGGRRPSGSAAGGPARSRRVIRAAATTRRSTTSTTWCRAFSSRS